MKFLASLAVAAAAVLAAATGAQAAEDHVVVLTDSNLHEQVKSNEFVLVEFYAPWCGHCKALEPEYKAAAAALKDYAPKVVLAKVDATVEKQVASEFGIQGFPTLKWFANGKASDYGGGRTQDTIVSWIKKRTGPACKDLASAADVDAFKASADVVVVGVFSSKDKAKAFESAAQADDNVAYGLAVGASAEVKQALGVTADDAVVLFKKFDEGRAQMAGDVTSQDAVAKFVSGNQLPLIVPFTQQNAPKIFGGAVKRHVLLFIDASDEKMTTDYKAMAKPVAEEQRGEYLFVSIDKSDSRVMEFFGVTDKDLPTTRIVELSEGGMKKFKLLGEPATTEVLRNSLKAHNAGEMKPDLKSEEPPASNDGPVKVLTGKTFNSIVKQPGKDVFVEFYAPWCGHCKKLAPVWEELGEKYKNNPNLIIAKMDSTANEVEDVNIQGFPTLKLWKAGAEEPVDYDGARELDAMVSFLEKHADSCKA